MTTTSPEENEFTLTSELLPNEQRRLEWIDPAGKRVKGSVNRGIWYVESYNTAKERNGRHVTYTPTLWRYV